MHSSLSIGDLARATGTKVETIRYYERVGVLPQPGRTAANYRTYTDADLARLSFIRRCRDLGFHLGQIEALLRLSDEASEPCSEVHEIASARLAEIERKLADLQALRRELKDLVGKCRSGAAIADCRLIEALAPHG